MTTKLRAASLAVIPPPPVSSVQLVKLEEANIHDGRVLVDDAAPAGVEVSHGFIRAKRDSILV